ncbi:hypothetical protein [Pedobacter frigiditerrae]|uniref:hypothetical protein n=1 Tax=Pedobacter frigiditerrae TaxID=2530452 RepID=UPI0029314C92|nr:hypothetical protein [Pedobacter frigiditerrae]
MKFSEVLKVLYGEVIKEINELLLISSSVKQLQNKPNLLIHTGFILWRENHYNIEFLYDPIYGRLFYQILNKNSSHYFRHIGLHMFLNEYDFYSPFNNEINRNTVKVKYFNKIYEDRLSSFKEFDWDFSNLPPNFQADDDLNNFDVQLNFGSLNCHNYSKMELLFEAKFRVQFELGNEILTLDEFPLSKNYQYYKWDNDILKDFFVGSKIINVKKVWAPSWNKQAEEELDNLDNDFPGWNSGILD